jgi:hypothetical protein
MTGVAIQQVRKCRHAYGYQTLTILFRCQQHAFGMGSVVSDQTIWVVVANLTSF